MVDNVQQNEEVPVANAPELSEEQKADLARKQKMMEWVGIDSARSDAAFIDIDYKGGRTVVILGTFGLHARMVGEYIGKELNERMNLEMDVEKTYDISLSCKREFCFSVKTVRVKVEPEHYSHLPKDEQANLPEFLWTLIIKHQEGEITIKGMPEDKARFFKKVIWMWMSYHNPNVQSDQGNG